MPKTPHKAAWSKRQFGKWLDRMGYSWSAAAKELGLAQRTIGAFAAGESPIDKRTMLACLYIEAQKGGGARQQEGGR